MPCSVSSAMSRLSLRASDPTSGFHISDGSTLVLGTKEIIAIRPTFQFSILPISKIFKDLKCLLFFRDMYLHLLS